MHDVFSINLPLIFILCEIVFFIDMYRYVNLLVLVVKNYIFCEIPFFLRDHSEVGTQISHAKIEKPQSFPVMLCEQSPRWILFINGNSVSRWFTVDQGYCEKFRVLIMCLCSADLWHQGSHFFLIPNSKFSQGFWS